LPSLIRSVAGLLTTWRGGFIVSQKCLGDLFPVFLPQLSFRRLNSPRRTRLATLCLCFLLGGPSPFWRRMFLPPLPPPFELTQTLAFHFAVKPRRIGYFWVSPFFCNRCTREASLPPGSDSLFFPDVFSSKYAILEERLSPLIAPRYPSAPRSSFFLLDPFFPSYPKASLSPDLKTPHTPPDPSKSRIPPPAFFFLLTFSVP